MKHPEQSQGSPGSPQSWAERPKSSRNLNVAYPENWWAQIPKSLWSNSQVEGLGRSSNGLRIKCKPNTDEMTPAGVEFLQSSCPQEDMGGFRLEMFIHAMGTQHLLGRSHVILPSWDLGCFAPKTYFPSGTYNLVGQLPRILAYEEPKVLPPCPCDSNSAFPHSIWGTWPDLR